MTPPCRRRQATAAPTEPPQEVPEPADDNESDQFPEDETPEDEDEDDDDDDDDEPYEEEYRVSPAGFFSAPVLDLGVLLFFFVKFIFNESPLCV